MRRGTRRKQSQRPHTQTRRDGAPKFVLGFIVRATRPCIQVAWLCGDAGTCPLAPERTRERDAISSAASAEAEGIEGATRKSKESPPGQLSLPFSTVGKNATAFWQRRFYDFNVWSSEKLREAGIHARESGETKTGHSSERLAVEQLVALREKAGRIDRD